MELEDDLEFCCRGSDRFLYHRGDSRRDSSNLLFIFLCGAIAICAMILPGISGSFILVLLGKYFYIMEAVKTFNVPVMLVFIAGAAIGITTFSRVLSFALRKFHDITIAVLAGFMLGSLNKVWPWERNDRDLCG